MHSFIRLSVYKRLYLGIACGDVRDEVEELEEARGVAGGAHREELFVGLSVRRGSERSGEGGMAGLGWGG